MRDSSHRPRQKRMIDPGAAPLELLNVSIGPIIRRQWRNFRLVSQPQSSALIDDVYRLPRRPRSIALHHTDYSHVCTRRESPHCGHWMAATTSRQRGQSAHHLNCNCRDAACPRGAPANQSRSWSTSKRNSGKLRHNQAPALEGSSTAHARSGTASGYSAGSRPSSCVAGAAKGVPLVALYDSTWLACLGRLRCP